MATKYSAHDASGGGAGTILDPYTDQELFDNVDGSTNALGLMMNTGTYTPAATLDFDVNAGTDLLPGIIRGANADGSDDGTVATISGSGLGAGDDLIDIGMVMYRIFENLRFTAATQYNIFCDQNAYINFINCQIDTAASHNMYVTATLGRFKLFYSEINNSVAGSGLAVSGAARGRYSAYRCKIHHNKVHGIHDGCSHRPYYQPGIIEDCFIYRNEGDGINHELSGAGYIGPIIRGNVIAFNDGDGLAVANTKSVMIVENDIFRSNGGYAINTNTGTIKQITSCKNNCSNNNTSGHIDINTNVLPGTGNITTDPKFVSEVDGSEDFSLQSDSPCLAAGIDGGIW